MEASLDPTATYLAADEDRFPNIKALLRICCTLPVGSADAERSFSCLRRLKTYLRNRMGEDIQPSTYEHSP